MSAAEIFLIILSSALALMLAACLAVHCRTNRKVKKLTDSVNDFISNQEMTDFSTCDTPTGSLQNSISELESMVMLEKCNSEARSRSNADFIADVSHQLKTPLAGIRLYSEMELEETHSQHCEKQLVLIDKMEKLIYALLRLEKLRADAYVMNFEKCSISETVNKIFDELRPLFGEKKFALHGDAVMRCDKEWISEALGNVIKNAGEHTAPDGFVEVTVSGNDAAVTVTVEDNGGGMPAEQLPMLFHRFFRSDSAPAENTGIGLAITKAIVEKHHGSIFAENGRLGLKIIMCFPVINASEKL